MVEILGIVKPPNLLFFPYPILANIQFHISMLLFQQKLRNIYTKIFIKYVA